MSNSTNGWGIMCVNVGGGERQRAHHAVRIAVLVLCLANVTAAGLSLDQFYPFDVSPDGDIQTPKKDDGGSQLITLNYTFPFFNRTDLRQLYVNNNGIISFLDELTTYKPINFNQNTTELPPLVAPFWADIDIENVKGIPDFHEAVYYRVTEDPEVLDLADADVRNYFVGQRNFTSKLAVIVTWYDVGYYGAAEGGKRKRNTFQTVLITDGETSFVVFNYNKIQWTTGSNSAGHTETGLGGDPAVVGFYSGRKDLFYLVEGSGTDRVINISQESNINIPGKFIFRTDGRLNGRIDDLRCSASNKITVFPTEVPMLGGRKIEITGPCLDARAVVLARIKELGLEFPCQVSPSLSAICVTPPMFKTGNLILELNPYGEGWDYATVITSVNVMNSPVLLTREQVDKWTVGQFVRVSWDQNSLPAVSRRLELLAYSYTSEIAELVSISNSSVAQGRRFVQFRLAENIVYSSLVTRLCWNNETHPHTLPECIWSDVFPVRWNSHLDSESWCENWIESERKQSRITVTGPFCPCTLTIASSDVGQFLSDPFCDKNRTNPTSNCTYNSNAKQCFRRKLKSSGDSGETCCYNDDGELMDIRDDVGSGTHQRYHYKSQGEGIVPFFSYFEEDLIPRLHCCVYSRRNCSQFKTLRNATTCTDYSPPSPAQAAGDPHIVTLDGKNYSFNGVGDFFLVRSDNGSFMIQVRAEQALDDKGLLQNATVFTHVAIGMPDVSDTVEIRKSGEGADVLVNGQSRTATTSQFNNISLTLADDGSYLIALEPVSVSISVTVTPDLLNIITFIGEQPFRGNIGGLLGNYNGDPDDDYIPRNGSEPLSPDASMKSIHFEFGMTWLVGAEESLLSEPFSQEVSVNFSPVFIDADDSQQGLPSDAQELCAGNMQCMFDYMVTQKRSVALATARFSKKFEDIKSTLEEKVVRCPFLDPPANGNKSGDGKTEGSVVTFTCDQGYQAQGSSIRECKDGAWTGSSFACVVEIKADDSSNKLVMIITVTAVATLTVLAILFVGIFCALRRWKKIPETSIPLDTNIPVFENPVFMQSLQSLTRDGRFKIPRPNFVDPSIFQEYF